jgi:hypothetical protein
MSKRWQIPCEKAHELASKRLRRFATSVKQGSFDHAAVHTRLNRRYVAHTANDSVDVKDCVEDRYLRSIPNLGGIVGALVSEERNLVFTSNRAENTVGIFTPDDETPLGLFERKIG